MAQVALDTKLLKCIGIMELRIGDLSPDSITIDPLIYPQTIIIDMMGFPPQGYTPISVTRATYIDMIPGLSDESEEREIEISQAPATENAAVAIAVTTADQSLGSKDITVNVPSGATITRVIALARINIMNNSATAQKIDLKLDVEGVELFDQPDVVGFGAVDGASTAYVIAEDASDEVTADGQVVTLEAFATLDAAASVRFQAQYYLFIVYRMGS